MTDFAYQRNRDSNMYVLGQKGHRKPQMQMIALSHGSLNPGALERKKAHSAFNFA